MTPSPEPTEAESVHDIDSATLVARIRARRGLTQAQLATEIGVSFATVNAWECARSRPRRRHRLQLEELAGSGESAAGPRRVVVVDDDPATLLIVAAMLEATGEDLEVATASDGVAGLLLAGSLHPDLVLLDVVMPGLDGFTVAERIADTPGLEHTTVVLMTADARPETRERAAASPVAALLAKPLDVADLRAVLAALPRTQGSPDAAMAPR